MNTFYKNLSMWLVIGLTMILLFNLFNKPQNPVTATMTYSEFMVQRQQQGHHPGHHSGR